MAKKRNVVSKEQADRESLEFRLKDLRQSFHKTEPTLRYKVGERVQRGCVKSMAFAAEFVKTAKMKYKRNEIHVEEARIILKAIHDHQELCKNHFKEPKSLGFKK